MSFVKFLARKINLIFESVYFYTRQIASLVGQSDKQLILICAPHRCASTLLYDCIRLFNEILPDKDSDTWFRLGCTIGRRYPRDLSSTTCTYVNNYLFNFRSSKKCYIPSFDIKNSSNFTIEKYHFHFLQSDQPENIKYLRNLSNLNSIVLAIREPKQAIISFLKYKLRSPEWEGTLSSDTSSVIDIFYKSFVHIRSISQEYPKKSIVFDYSYWYEYSSKIKASIFSFHNSQPSCQFTSAKDVIDCINSFRSKEMIDNFRGDRISSERSIIFDELLENVTFSDREKLKKMEQIYCDLTNS